MEEITRAYAKSKSAATFSGVTTTTVKPFTRLFDEHGEELKEMIKLIRGKFEYVWASVGGESWRGEHGYATLAVSISLNMLFAMKNQPAPEPSSFITHETNNNNNQDSIQQEKTSSSSPSGKLF